MKIVFGILQLVCIAFFLFSLFYLIMAVGTSHKIPLQTYLKIGIAVFFSIALYLYIHFIKRRNY
jgi:hypothetical protein